MDLQSKEMWKLYSRCFTRYVYFFCAIRKRRLPDSPEEDPLLFSLGEEGIDDKHIFHPVIFRYSSSGASELDQGSKHISTLTQSCTAARLEGGWFVYNISGFTSNSV